VRPLGIEVRAGLHTGECELIDDHIGGIAVHTGARVAALAGASEVLVSSTVKDLVAGSGLRFAERGVHALKGVPGEWRLAPTSCCQPRPSQNRGAAAKAAKRTPSLRKADARDNSRVLHRPVPDYAAWTRSRARGAVRSTRASSTTSSS
jgi:hypothetical protein